MYLQTSKKDNDMQRTVRHTDINISERKWRIEVGTCVFSRNNLHYQNS